MCHAVSHLANVTFERCCDTVADVVYRGGEERFNVFPRGFEGLCDSISPSFG